MASGGKKGKKKGMTVDLFTFMSQDVNITADKTVVMAPKVSSWADDVDEEPEFTNRERLILPTAPKAARGVDIDESLIPKNGPYCARVANLPYEVEESDLELFFKDLRIKSIRMPRDGNRIKGYAFVEFEEKLHLIEAIGRNDLLIKNRKIRVELNLNEDRNRNRGGPRDSEPQEDRTTGDWRSARAELPPPPQGREYGRDRDRSGFGSYGGRSGGFEERRQDDRYGGRRGFGSSYDRRDRDERREPEPPKERQRLQLAPRTKPVEETDGQKAQSSIFGGAKPVDTLKKELEIEQKLKSTAISPPVEEKSKPKVDIFGGARPVDTLAREREIEEKLKKDRVEPERPSRSNGYDRPIRSGPNVNRSTSRDEPYRSRDSYRSSSRDELRPPRDSDRREYRQSSRDHSPVRREHTPPRETEQRNAWSKKPTISQESREDMGGEERPPSSADRDRRTPEPRGRSDRDLYPPADRGYDRSRDRDERRDDSRNFNGRDSYERRDYRGSGDDRRGRYSDERRDDRGYETRRQYSGDDRRSHNDDQRYDDRRQYNDDRRRYDPPSRRDEPRRDDVRERDGDRRDYGSRSTAQDRRDPPRSQGDRERDRKPQEAVPKKYEEPPKPNFAQSSKFSLLNTEDEGIPSGDEE